MLPKINEPNPPVFEMAPSNTDAPVIQYKNETFFDTKNGLFSIRIRKNLKNSIATVDFLQDFTKLEAPVLKPTSMDIPRLAESGLNAQFFSIFTPCDQRPGDKK